MAIYLIPAALAFCVGLCLWAIQRARRVLVYEVVESEPFPVDGGLSKYFVIRVVNSGNTALEDISLQVTFSSGRIRSHKTSDENIKLVEDTERARLTTCIPLLNPKDRFQLTATLEGSPGMNSPDVLARCVGVTARPAPEGNVLEHPLIATALPIIACVFAVMMAANAALSFWTTGQQEKLSDAIKNSETAEKFLDQASQQLQNIPASSHELKESIEKLEKLRAESEKLIDARTAEQKQRAEGKPESAQLIFSVMNRAGLGHLVPDLVMSGDHPEYWKTGLFLMHSFLKEEADGDKYVNAISGLMSGGENMAASSYGFLAYLAGKIEQKRGRAAQAMEFFERCKAKAPLMYQHLMSQDPAYDLSSVQGYLRKSAITNSKLPNVSPTP